MGCSETKNNLSNLPVMICIFELGNEIQKEYCIKLKENFKHNKSIRYEVKSFANSPFSIMFQINGQNHQIQNVFDENEMQNTLNKMYNLLDQADIKPDPNVNTNNVNQIQNPNANPVPNPEQNAGIVNPSAPN